MIKKHLLVWFGIVLLAIANGAARDLLYSPAVGELRAHQLSTLILIALTGCAAWFAGVRWPLPTRRAALTVGECWMAMTVAFEFLLGGVILGRPWMALLHDYDITSGRLWVLVPLWLLVVPVLVLAARARLTRGPAR